MTTNYTLRSPQSKFACYESLLRSLLYDAVFSLILRLSSRFEEKDLEWWTLDELWNLLWDLKTETPLIPALRRSIAEGIEDIGYNTEIQELIQTSSTQTGSEVTCYKNSLRAIVKQHTHYRGERFYRTLVACAHASAPRVRSKLHTKGPIPSFLTKFTTETNQSLYLMYVMVFFKEEARKRNIPEDVLSEVHPVFGHLPDSNYNRPDTDYTDDKLFSFMSFILNLMQEENPEKNPEDA